MIPATFDYVRAESIDDALDRLAADEDAKLMAGGHSLLPIMKLRMASPTTLVDISRLPELCGLVERDGVLHIGAGVRFRHIERSPMVQEALPLLAHAAGTIGDPQVRSRGTVGGTLVHADPAADLPAVMLALDATMVLRGPGGERRVAVDDFFVDFWETAVGPDEILVSIEVPVRRGQPWSYQKFRQRTQEWAIVGVAVQGGPVATVALVNMATTPVRARATEEALANGASPAEAGALADHGTSPSADLKADLEYRRHLCRTLTTRALTEVAAGGRPAGARHGKG